MKTRPQTLAAFAVATLLLAPRPSLADARQAQDFLTGNGTAGPYTLTWRHVLLGSETVLMNGQALHWGSDYSFDADAGTITFTHPLPATDAVVVRYGYDTATAKAQGGGLNLPLDLGLGQNLSLNGLYHQVPGDPASPGALNFGLNGGWKSASGGALTTKLLFLPALTGKDAQAAPDGMARLGMALGGQTRLGRFTQLTFGVSHAGSGLGSAGGDWQAGQEQLSLGGVVSPNKAIQATLGYTQTDAADHGKAPSQAQVTTALALTPNNRLHLQTGLVQTTGGGGSPTQTLTAGAALQPTQKTELDAAFSDKSAHDPADTAQSLDIKAAVTASRALALTADASQSKSGVSAVAQTLRAGAVLKPNGESELDATYSNTGASGPNSAAQGLYLKAALAPNPAVALTAGLNQSRHGTQNINTQNFQMSLTPGQVIRIRTGVAMSQQPSDDTQATSVNGTLLPGHILQVAGGYTWRTQTANRAGVADVYDSSGAKITFAPLAALHLVGTYAQNPTDGGGTVQHQADHGLDLQTSLGALSLTGGYLWSRDYASDATATSLDVGLGLRFSSSTLLTGDYKHCLTLGGAAGGTDTYTLGLTRKLGQSFDLSMNGTMQQQMGASAPAANTLTASADLGMKF